MKKLLFLLVVMALLSACEQADTRTKPNKAKKEVKEIKAMSNRDIIRSPIDANEAVDTTNIAKIVFDKKSYDFGTVNEGDIIRHVFKFTNEGEVPLLITKAKSTCGCTVPEWPEAPIAPGEKGEISVRFDTKNKTGRQGKPITIIANTYPKDTFLQLKGFVTPQK